MGPEDILDILEDLGEDEFKKFKWFLEQEGIRRSQLEVARRPDTVSLMEQRYGLDGAVEVTKKVLEKIPRNDLVQSLFIFQQDNDPKHTAKITKEWLRNNSVTVLDWPSQSPDLNPIEDLWRDLKMAVHQRSPSDLTELERICKEEWQRIPKSRCDKPVASFPRRLMAVLAQKGLTMGPEDILDILEDLGEDEFKKFKWFLEQEGIRRSQLEGARRHDTVSLMVQRYELDGAVEVTKKVLEKIPRKDLVEAPNITVTAQDGSVSMAPQITGTHVSGDVNITVNMNVNNTPGKY
uniref:Tc1-like transposase DDE domain-containing protein n=1 Tax=Mastacembelus armatus TaxID=205130 RepID=A0A3Q3S9H9_9TELE